MNGGCFLWCGIMRARWLQLAMVFWLTAWYGVIVPGHQRGMVLVPGAEGRIAAQAGSCCEENEAVLVCQEPPPADGSTPAPINKKKSDPNRVANCAVCAIAGLIDLPPPLVLSPVTAESGLEFRPLQRDVFALELPGHSIPFKRGPPAASSRATA